jgi:hypothetical protein
MYGINEISMNKFPSWILLVAGLIPAALIITWGEMSEFNINLWILPIVNLPQVYLDYEQFLIGLYYLVSPILILTFMRKKSVFQRDNWRFVFLVFSTIFSYGILRYLEFLYDTRWPPITDPFGNFYPLAFWSLPLVSTAAAFVFLSTRSERHQNMIQESRSFNI